jgi:hypothetical protein
MQLFWTDLPGKVDGVDEQVPTIEQATSYLRTLDNNTRATAEEYIRRAPKQIETEYRRKFETEFNWTAIEN